MARQVSEKTKAILAAIGSGKGPAEIAADLNKKHPDWNVTPGLVSNLKSKSKKDGTTTAAPKVERTPASNGTPVSQPQPKVTKFSDELRKFKEAVAAVGGAEEAKELLELLRM